jgi:colanic acid/amylovoran biosynthesis glycosyltransferase
MSVLFMMPLMTAPSEVWMQRMLEELDYDLGTVVAWDTGGATTWRNRVRAVSLQTPSALDRLLSVSRFHNMVKHDTEQILLREIRRKGITHALCHYGDFALRFMNVWRQVNIPLFVHFHGYDATFDRRHDADAEKAYFPETYARQIGNLAERATFIANSEFTKSLLMNAGIQSSRVHVKYLGVPVPAAAKVHKNVEEIHVLHLGRLVDFKSPDRTIRSFEIAQSKGLRGRLTIAGEGPFRVTCELLRMRSLYKSSIQILGAVTAEHAQSLLADADIYTQHNIKGEISRQEECFGVSIIEAMATGLPVVGTRSGGVVETVVDNETGFLVEPGNVEGQAEAILRLAGDRNLRQRLGDAGRGRVAEHFSMEGEGIRLRSIMGLPLPSH